MSNDSTRPQERSQEEFDGLINILLLAVCVIGTILLVQFVSGINQNDEEVLSASAQTIELKMPSDETPLPIPTTEPTVEPEQELKAEFAIGGSDEVVEEELPPHYFMRPLRGGWRTRGILVMDAYGRPHHGVDIACETGTPIVAAADGIVVVSDDGGENHWGGGHGRHIVIRHSNGWTTKYCHLNEIKVWEGKRVYKGEFIALSGHSGNVRSEHGGDGSHLHYQVRRPDGKYIDLGI